MLLKEGRRGRHDTRAISAYHHLSCEFEPRSWRGVYDTTLCDVRQCFITIKQKNI
jgi:hypothetical protein